MTDMTSAEFIRDLAARMFRSATPAMGFDQGDTDRLYAIANRLAALEQAGEPEQPLPTLQRLGQEFDAGEAEPVAWMIRKSGGDLGGIVTKEGKRLTEDERQRGWAETPLYAHPPQSREPSLTIADAWQDLVDKSDRTSPEEYPDMALITRDELADYMSAAAPSKDVQS